MNALINDERSEYYIEEKKNHLERNTFGDVFAVSLLGTYTLSALVISCWSAIVLLTGNAPNGGPIGLIFNKIVLSILS